MVRALFFLPVLAYFLLKQERKCEIFLFKIASGVKFKTLQKSHLTTCTMDESDEDTFKMCKFNQLPLQTFDEWQRK